MTTVFLSEDKPAVDYSHIMDSVLLSLRKDLRAELNQISSIEWKSDDYDPSNSSRKKKMAILEVK